MGQDDEWVANVKRWCQDQKAEAVQADPVTTGEASAFSHDDIGYETAHPALQARHWPDAGRY